MLELIGGPKSAAVVGAVAVLAQAFGGCFLCDDAPPAKGPTVTITGPSTVTAGEEARFSVEAQGLGPGAPCPVGVNWLFAEKDGQAPVQVSVPNPPTRKLDDGSCQITLVQTPHTWPKGATVGSRPGLVTVRINGVVVNSDGSKTITVVTPPKPDSTPPADTKPKPEDYKTIGSSLTAKADMAESHQQDSAYWNATLTNGTVQVPEDGQISEVRVKGNVVPAANGNAPLNSVKVQILRADGDALKIPDPGGTSAPFVLPVGGDADQITTFKPENLCAKSGDLVGLNTLGGWDETTSPDQGGYYDGVPFQIFARSPGSATGQFHKHEGVQNGSRLENGVGDNNEPQQFPVVRQDQELLMQVIVATGNARSYECGGPNTYRTP
ncbi:MAG TPA: hypothetical protein VF533_05825 [Solirubrobacteraceae bacterium]